MSQAQTILIFDSGVGGLSVYEEVHAKLPHCNYIYLFDNAAYPYGELEPSTLIERVNQLIMAQVKLHDIDIVIIACNTASTIVLPSLREKLTIPVVGVVPAIKPASLVSLKCVGLIATPATVTRQYTQDLIANFSNGKSVELLGSTKLVDMAEEKLRGERVSIDELTDVLSSLRGKIDVGVLGCTHFPLIKEEIQQVLGNDVTLIDSGKAIARRVVSLLKAEPTEKREGSKVIFASAPPKKEEALNQSLHKMGFSSVQVIHLGVVR